MLAYMQGSLRDDNEYHYQLLNGFDSHYQDCRIDFDIHYQLLNDFENHSQ